MRYTNPDFARLRESRRPNRIFLPAGSEGRSGLVSVLLVMCTITQYRDESRILVTMNRDELIGRCSEEPPRRYLCGGMIWVAPRAGAARNTWIGANSCGAVLALLNPCPKTRTVSDTSRSPRLSLIPILLEMGSAGRIVDFLENDFNPRSLAPFSLLVLSPCSGDLFAWNGGRELARSSLRSGWSLWSSSAHRSQTVANWRRDQFYRWKSAGSQFNGLLPSFNLMRVPERASWSPLMKRPESCTRSITQVELCPEAGWLEMRYWPQPTPASIEPSSVIRIPAADRAECLGNRLFA